MKLHSSEESKQYRLWKSCFLNEDGSPFGRQMILLSISLKELQELSTDVTLKQIKLLLIWHF
jgi:hypothetical protein